MKKLISKDADVEEEIVVEKAIVEEADDFTQALELYEKGEYSTSKDLLNKILSVDKKNVEALTLMAKILYDQDQKDIALLFTKKALAVDKSNEMANELEVLLTNKPKEDSSQISSLDDVETLYEEAYDLYEQGDLSTASEILEKLLDFDDRNSEALALMGLIYYHSGFFPKAVEYYRKAIKINKNGEMVRELKMRVS
jgi:DEAD/DEAH box helicase domain-containing protein